MIKNNLILSAFVFVFSLVSFAAETRENIVFIGNPGAGKSTILNALVGQRVAKSGMSEDGVGVTKVAQVIKHGAINLIDTPGLEDEPEERERTDQEIKAALKYDGNYRIFFVITLEGEKIRDSELETIKHVMDAIPAKDKAFNIIINKLASRLMQKTEMLNDVRAKIGATGHKVMDIYCLQHQGTEIDEITIDDSFRDWVYQRSLSMQILPPVISIEERFAHFDKDIERLKALNNIQAAANINMLKEIDHRQRMIMNEQSRQMDLAAIADGEEIESLLQAAKKISEQGQQLIVSENALFKVTQQLLQAAQKPAFIQVCKVPLAVSKNEPSLSGLNVDHVWIRGIMEDQVRVLSFQTASENPDIAAIIGGADVKASVSTAELNHSAVTCQTVFATTNYEEFDAIWNVIESEFYLIAARESYNLYDNNCGIVTERALNKARLKFPFDNVNAQSSTRLLSQSIAFLGDEASPVDFMSAAFHGTAALLNITGISPESTDIFDALGDLSQAFK